MSHARALPSLTLQDISVGELLGVGGAGAVERALWGARPLDLKRPLCGLSPPLEERARAALAREEAHALIALRHDQGRLATPALVARLVAGEGAARLTGLLFEATEGLSAREELRLRTRAGRPLTPREVGARVELLCAALSSLHAAGVTHGDLCLSNVLLRDEDEGLSLIDLGSAWSAELPYCPRACRARPRYTSPERARFEREATSASQGDPRPAPSWASAERSWAQDSFALGACWHEWVTGAPPDLDAPPAARALAALGWPPRWAEAVEALCAPDPEGRPRPAEVGGAEVVWGGAWW